MKSLFILIALAIIGYWLYTFYQQNPDSVPHFHTGLSSTPIPSPAPPTPIPKEPTLETIPVAKGETLTHAKVKSFSSTAVLFVCDQGIFEVTYDRLPPGYAAYYVPRVPAPTPTPSPTPTPTAGPTPVPTRKVFVEHSSRTSEEDANAVANYNRDIENYNARMADDQKQMDLYHSQSSFNNSGAVSQADFDAAQADYNKWQAKLADRLAQGP